VRDADAFWSRHQDLDRAANYDGTTPKGSAEGQYRERTVP
jgi:hypothetical protein